MARNKIEKKINLHNAEISECTLIGVNLVDADCTRLQAVRTDFSTSKMKNAIFIDSTLYKANFSKCDCRNVNFSDCDLTCCDFSDADLRGAIFENAVTYGMITDGAKRD